MKKRISSLLLAVALCFSLLPATAFAEEASSAVFVNGIELTGENTSGNFAGGEDTSKGSYSYDPATKTLTLTDATIDTATDTNCIKADGDLNIVLVGENKIGENFTGEYLIRTEGKLKISGEGSLDVAAGVIYSRDHLTLDKVKITTKSGFKAARGMEVNGGSLDIDFYDTKNRHAFFVYPGELVFNGDVTLKTNSGYPCDGITAEVVTINGGNINLPCYVLGRSGVNINGGNSIIGNNDPANGQTYEYGLFSDRTLNFNGGDITVKGTVAAAYTNHIDEANLNVNSKMKIVAPTGAKVATLYKYDDEYEYYYRSFSMDSKLTLNYASKPTNACKEVTLSYIDPYGVYVDGVELTNKNYKGNIDGLENGSHGSYSYDAKTNTLTLTNVHLDDASNYDLRGNRAAIRSVGDLNLVLNGTNTSEYNGDLGNNSEEYLISVDGNLTISGTGSLTTSGTAGKLNGMRVAGDLIFDEATLNLVGESKVHNTVINGGTITLDNGGSNHPDTFFSVEGDITVNDGVLAVVGKNSKGSLNVNGFITINDGTVSTDSDMLGAGGVIINGGTVNAGSKSAKFGISTLGDLTIAGGEVVAKGECGAIMLIAECDHASSIGTLTLSNGVKVIRTNRDGGTYKTYDESIINEHHVNMGTYTDDDALVINQNSGYPSNACVEVAFSSIEHYNVCVDGVELTEKNYEGNIDGLVDGSHGSYSYDAETKTLTLTDAVIDTVTEIPISTESSNKCAIYSKDDITIALVGESTVDTGVDEALSIFTKGNLVITSGGDGESSEDGASSEDDILGTINCKDSEAIHTYGDFSIANAMVTIDKGVLVDGNAAIDGGSLNTYFISADGNININGDVVAIGYRDDISITSKGVVTIDGGNVTSKYGICGYSGIVINDGNISAGYIESLEEDEFSVVGLMSLGDIEINGGTIDANGIAAILCIGLTADTTISVDENLDIVTFNDENGSIVTSPYRSDESMMYITTFSAAKGLVFMGSNSIPIPQNACKHVKIAPKQFTVTFNMNGHGTAPASQTVSCGSAVTAPEAPTAKGYTFDGWFADADCQTAWGFENDVITDNTTIYAKWTKSASGSSSSGGSSNSSTTTITNPDGSTTTTTTDKATGTVTETTKKPDGSSETVETRKDGTKTVTEKDAAGNTTETVIKPDGSSTTTDTQKNGVTTVTDTDKNGKVTDAKVTVPDSVKDGAQAVIPADLGKQDGTVSAEVTYPDGTKETVKATYEDGKITVPVKGSAEIEILDDFVPKADADSFFVDVPDDAYYTDAVKWAVENDVTKGTSATTFSPTMDCTRGQVVTFLYRAMGTPAVSGDSSFTDVDAGTYYADAVKWAVENGITNGVSDDQFAPEKEVTRAQFVTFLWRAAGSPVVNYAMNFKDVDADSYYTEAVRWAASEGITLGTSADTFSPDGICNRAQIVTFLYRYFGA